MRVSGGLLMVLQEGNHSIYFTFILISNWISKSHQIEMHTEKLFMNFIKNEAICT